MSHFSRLIKSLAFSSKYSLFCFYASKVQCSKVVSSHSLRTFYFSFPVKLPYSISASAEGQRSEIKLSMYVSRALDISLSFRFIELFQWFLIVLSVLPSNTLAISAHLLLCFRCIRNKIHSSSLDQFIFFIRGFKWLCHLSLHCLPIRPVRCSAMVVHL